MKRLSKARKYDEKQHSAWENSEGRVQMCLQSTSSLMSPDAKTCFNNKKNAVPSDMRTLQVVKNKYINK